MMFLTSRVTDRFEWKKPILEAGSGLSLDTWAADREIYAGSGVYGNVRFPRPNRQLKELVECLFGHLNLSSHLVRVNEKTVGKFRSAKKYAQNVDESNQCTITRFFPTSCE